MMKTDRIGSSCDPQGMLRGIASRRTDLRLPHKDAATARFNPHPTRRPRAIFDGTRWLTSVFQSSPDPKAGCNRRCRPPSRA